MTHSDIIAQVLIADGTTELFPRIYKGHIFCEDRTSELTC